MYLRKSCDTLIAGLCFVKKYSTSPKQCALQNEWLWTAPPQMMHSHSVLLHYSVPSLKQRFNLPQTWCRSRDAHCPGLLFFHTMTVHYLYTVERCTTFYCYLITYWHKMQHIFFYSEHKSFFSVDSFGKMVLTTRPKALLYVAMSGKSIYIQHTASLSSSFEFPALFSC